MFWNHLKVEIIVFRCHQLTVGSLKMVFLEGIPPDKSQMNLKRKNRGSKRTSETHL